MSSMEPWSFLIASKAGLCPVVSLLMNLQSFFGTTNFYNLTLSRMRTPVYDHLRVTIYKHLIV